MMFITSRFCKAGCIANVIGDGYNDGFKCWRLAKFHELFVLMLESQMKKKPRPLVVRSFKKDLDHSSFFSRERKSP
jgi:hypothetical protein